MGRGAEGGGERAARAGALGTAPEQAAVQPRPAPQPQPTHSGAPGAALQVSPGWPGSSAILGRCSAWAPVGAPHAGSGVCPSFVTRERPENSTMRFYFTWGGIQPPPAGVGDCNGERQQHATLLARGRPSAAAPSPTGWRPPTSPAWPSRHAADCACEDVPAGTRALQSAPGALYSQPCALPAADGTLAKCAPFLDTGRRAGAGAVLSRACRALRSELEGVLQRKPAHCTHCTCPCLPLPCPAGGTPWRVEPSPPGRALPSCLTARGGRATRWTTPAPAAHQTSAPPTAPPALRVSTRACTCQGQCQGRIGQRPITAAAHAAPGRSAPVRQPAPGLLCALRPRGWRAHAVRGRQRRGVPAPNQCE